MSDGKEKAPCTAATAQDAKGKMLYAKNNPFTLNCQVPARCGAVLQRVIDAMRQNSRMAFKVAGTCLAGIGIEDGDTVLVAFDRRPRPPVPPTSETRSRYDVCLCWGTFPAADRSQRRPALLVKGYIGVMCGRQLVGTFWEDRANCAFTPDAILGVVYAVFDGSGRVKWEESPEGYPLTLPAGNTIRSGEITDADPMQ